MTERRDADAVCFQVMVGLCMIWGAQQVAIKLAAPDVPTIVQASLRSGISALLVAGVMAIRGGWRGSEGTLGAGLAAGALFAVEFLLLAVALQHTTAGHVAVFLYTSPIFSALGLHVLVPSERLGRAQWAGIGVCFAGIAVAFLSGGEGASLLGDGLAVGAGAAWGATTIVIRGSRLASAPPSLTLLYQLGTAFLLLGAIALVTQRSASITATSTAVASILFQGVVVSFASYLAWFTLLRRYKAAVLSAFSFMTPVFGVLAGVLFLHEPLRPNFAAGALLVLTGISLVSGAFRRRPLS